MPYPVHMTAAGVSAMECRLHTLLHDHATELLKGSLEEQSGDMTHGAGSGTTHDTLWLYDRLYGVPRKPTRAFGNDPAHDDLLVFHAAPSGIGFVPPHYIGIQHPFLSKHTRMAERALGSVAEWYFDSCAPQEGDPHLPLHLMLMEVVQLRRPSLSQQGAVAALGPSAADIWPQLLLRPYASLRKANLIRLRVGWETLQSYARRAIRKIYAHRIWMVVLERSQRRLRELRWWPLVAHACQSGKLPMTALRRSSTVMASAVPLPFSPGLTPKTRDSPFRTTKGAGDTATAHNQQPSPLLPQQREATNATFPPDDLPHGPKLPPTQPTGTMSRFPTSAEPDEFAELGQPDLDDTEQQQHKEEEQQQDVAQQGERESSATQSQPIAAPSQTAPPRRSSLDLVATAALGDNGSATATSSRMNELAKME